MSVIGAVFFGFFKLIAFVVTSIWHLILAGGALVIIGAAVIIGFIWIISSLMNAWSDTLFPPRK